ncbi:MAG: T9SS type A sorting domain-containing protein, partial [Candidatus Symbiothrix sp.]|nr:T9SS type A sorting domain-containing protein [Candidatus Symbiothrix sp.]
QRQYYGNGNRWEEALAEFADALKYAESHPTITEIWVASGYYKPLYSINDSQDERDRSFVLPPGVSVYGGFSGNETNKEQRTKSNLTQLSSVNSIIYPYHVVVAVNNKPDKPIVFDGFNIQSGLADGEGFVSVEGREVSRSYGGGIYAYATGVNTKITLSGNTVSNNQADSIGGGVYAYANAGAQIALDENSIANNQADSLGGGVYAYAGENAVLQLRNNQIGSNNYYDSYYSSYSQIVQKSTKGGGVYAYAGEAGSTINLSNNTITTNNSFNFTYSYGSAAIDISASSFGGGVYALTAGAAAKITLSGNHISTNGNTTISLYDTEVNGSRSLKGGGIYASAGNNSQIKIDKNTIIDNSHHSSYGDKVHVDIISSGGGIYTEGLGVLSLDNNLIVRNDATIAGGGIYADGKATLSGNTIVRNTSTGKGAGIYADGNPLVYNSIVWNNEKEEGVTDNINKETGSSLTVSYSYVGDNAADVLPEVSTGEGNILNPDSPGFINADDINYEYDYRLSAGSLCIDKGSNAFADPNGADLYGSPRISGGVVDMGAIERLRLTPSGEKRLYVNKSASGDGSGTNWVNAVPELAIALAYAVENPDEVREVWVAAGTYTPTISPTASASNRFFLLSSDISVYGGFTGTESNLEDRNPAANETILSGKLGEHEGAADHVVVAVGNKADSQIILDGFTITGGGNNDGNYYYGGGFYVGYQVGGAFVQSYSGGGVYLATLEQGVSFMISGNKITGNHTLGEGGGIFVDPGYYRTGNADSTVIRIEANEISNNQTTSNGGGVHVAYNRFSFTQALPVVHIEANKISNNQATYDGGGIYVENENYGNNHIYISSNLINENNAGTSGGGAYLSGPLLASGNTVVNNKANYSAGGVLANSETTAVSNSIIWGNTANYYNNYYTQANNKTLTYSYLGDFAESNSYYIGENTITDSADPGFTNYAQGDYSLSANSICIDKGNNSRAVPGSRIDLAGAPRIAGGRIDMGAYERELSPVSPVDRIYVNKAQTSGNGSGDSWQNAFTELVDALKYTEEYQKQTGLIEVWVAKGVYHPLYILGQGRTSRTFLLVPGVGVYGGFDGTETDLASRNPAKNETILSGDIKNDDTGDIHSGFTNRSDNSDHTVIAANNSDQAIVLDGLTITGGGSDNSSSSYIYTNGYTVPPYYGAGIYALSEVGDITINDLKITGNNALENGGGVYAQMSGGTFTINTTAITGNTSSYYAGIYASVSNPDAHFIVSNSLVSDNASYAYSVNFQSENKGKITLSGVTISNNKSIGSNAASGVSIYSDNVDPDAIDVNIYNSIIWDKEAANNNSYGVWHMDYNYLSEDPNNGDIVFGAHNKIGTKNPFKNQETGDYRLGRSICVDAGSNGYALGTTDITGAPRIYNNNVDMGAYEFDGSYDLDDFIIWTGNIDTDWDTADNWNTKEIPDATSSVYIPGGLHTYPILTAAGNAAVKDVRFGPGAEIGRQDLLAYEKAFVQLDFSTNGLDRNRWYMLANPLQELYAGDFSFGGYPGMDMKLFKTEQGQINKTVWNRIDSLTQSFSAGDGFIVWLASNRQENKGLKLSNGILELPYFDNDNVSADVHWTHTYDAVAEASSFGGWKEENGSIVANGTPKTAPRDLGKAYQLAGQIVEKSLDAGTDLFAIAGNPYMSSIDFTELQNANNTLIKGTYQIWIGPGGSLGGSYAGYNVSTGAFGREGVNLNSYIAPMQSFIVEKLDGNATTALAFDLAAIGVNGVSPGLRSAAPQGDKLAIVASTAQAGVRTVIASRQEGGDSFGPTDSRKLFDEINSIPDVYTLKPVANNEQVATAVNVLGENTGETLVPLAIATTHKGELTFTFSGMDTYNARIFLLDTETNTETELTGKAQYEYKFNYVPEQSGGKTVANESRFFIRLHKVATGVDAIASEAVRIYASRPGTLQVVSTHPLHQVMVYNLQGSKVYDAQVQTNTHKVEGLVGGVYLVKVVSGNTVKMEKVIVRN